MFIKINRRGVRLGVALIGGVCVSVPLIRCGSVRAAAAALDEYTLSAEQTLALYGQQIELEIYANNATYLKNAEFVGTTQALTEYNGYPVSNGVPNPPVTYAFGNFVDNVYDWMSLNRMQHTNYLIYRIYIDPYSQPFGMPFSVNLTNSIDVTAYGFGTSVLWSVYPDSGYSPNNDSSHPYYNCNYTLYGSSVQDVLGSGGILAAGDIASGYSSYYASISTLPYGIEVSEQQGLYYFNNPYGLNSYFGAVCFAGSQVDGGSQITVGSQTIYIKNESNILPYTGYTQGTNTFYNKNYNLGDSSDYATYLLVQCPTLYGDYILPGGGGDSGDIDLSQIEEYLEQQTEYMSNVSEEATVQTRQLIAILAKLEQIYQNMPDLSGLNVPSLHNSPDISIDSQVDSFLSDEFSNADSVVDQDALEALEDLPVNDFLGLISRVRNWFPVEIVTVWGILLVVSFVSWFIFRGRGG